MKFQAIAVVVAAQTFSPSAGWSQQNSGDSSALADLFQIEEFVNANLDFCREFAPETFFVAKRAVDQWHAVNATEFLWAWTRSLPELHANVLILRDSVRADLGQSLRNRGTGRAAEWCNNLPALLSDTNWNLKATYSAALAFIEDMAKNVDDDFQIRDLTQGVALAPIPVTPLQEALAQGYDPEEHPLPGEFRCYAEDTSTTDYATFVLQITEPGKYNSSFGPGIWGLDEDEDLIWRSGPLTDAYSYVSFDDIGQTVSLRRVERNGYSVNYECFMAGATDESLAISSALVTPQIGTYECTDVSTGKTQPFKILSRGVYEIGSETGNYLVSELLDNSSGEIDWVSGPFAGERSFYSEEEGTGLREFSISTSNGRAIGGFVYSSSELALTCEGIGPPVRYAAYGDAPAPPVAAGTQMLEGQFYRYELQFNGTFSAPEPVVYTFQPDGYVFIGPPSPGAATDCSRTRPNGMPVCASYQVVGNQIKILEDRDETQYLFAMNGTVPVFDSEPMTPVQPATQTRLDGHYWSNFFSSTGFCGPYSFCSSTYIEWNYVFSPDGRFIFTTDSQNLASSNTAIGSTNVSGNSSDADRGTYTIEGNTITLAFDNGAVTSHFYLELEPGKFMIDDQSYTPKEDSEQ